jgi:hypothetical protein
MASLRVPAPPAILARVAFSLILALSFASSGFPQAAEVVDGTSRSLARAFYEEARALAEAGDWKAASSLLGEAVAHDGTDSDIRYLAALAAYKTGAALGDALAELDAAIVSGRFSDYTEREARMVAAGFLADERRWDKAFSMLPPADADSLLEPRWRLTRARAFYGLGQKDRYAAELSEAMRRFPDDPSFPRLLFTRATATGTPSTPALRAPVEWALSRLTRYAQFDAEMPVLAAPFMPDRRAAADAVRAFRAAGGRSALATLRALEYGILGEAQAASELFSGDYSLAFDDIAMALRLARTDAGRTAIASALATFSGVVVADRDSDGIAEEKMVLRKGLAVSFALDLDQDRAVDIEVDFDVDGLPRSASVRPAGSSLFFEYAGYPVLSSARITDVESVRTYMLESGALSYAPVEMKLVAGSGRAAIYLPAPLESTAPTERALAASALGIRTERAAESETVYLERGVPIKREIRQGGRVVAVAEYRLGLPSIERADLDGDGRFETERGYEMVAAPDPDSGAGGRAELAWARVDADGDGIFEYREETRFPFRKEWDLDANGSVDAIQYQLRDGSVRCEYSSRLDGRLDEALTFRPVKNAGSLPGAAVSDEILAFSKEGSPVSLIPDANPSLLWIGAKPFDLGADLPDGEGVYMRMGKRYRIVRAGSRYFAELLP